MSLVVALAKSNEAVIGGDRRSITFLGKSPELEDELYSGQIADDQALVARAEETGAILYVSDGREKVWRHKDLLVGEVTEISPLHERRRRIYITPGARMDVEISGGEARIKATGGTGCVVYGNQFTQKIAGEIVARAKGRVDEPLIREIFIDAARKTASVSREHIILKSEKKLADPQKALREALEEDCQKCGWRLCAPQ